ncbi:hypothetical protein GCM10009527_044410 [Actinomadura nitritigenes]
MPEKLTDSPRYRNIRPEMLRTPAKVGPRFRAARRGFGAAAAILWASWGPCAGPFVPRAKERR